MGRGPLVTVLMSVFNDAPYVDEAARSILGQTLADFEFLIIDDGSSDDSMEKVRSFRDERIRVLRNHWNIGLPRSLNVGLAAARGRYVARMDADDVALPQRLRRQVDFLEGAPEVGIVGSGRRLIDEQGRHLKDVDALADDLSIRWKCLLGSPFTHPAVVVRREVLSIGKLQYSASFPAAEDYQLWARLLARTRGANLPEPLLCYRLRAGVSRTSGPQQRASHDRVALAANRLLLPDFPLDAEQVRQLRGRYGGWNVRDPDMDPTCPAWAALYERMLEAFVAAHRARPGVDEFFERQRAHVRSAAA